MTAQMGRAVAIQLKKLIRSPVASSMRLRPIRFGGLPTGVSSPPTLAPYASINSRAIATRGLVRRASSSSRSVAGVSSSPVSWPFLVAPATVPRIAIAVGSNMATVAVLDTKADSAQVMRPNATTVRVVDDPTPLTASIRNAKRRARPWRSIAWAMMNAPMNVKIVVDPNGARMSSAGATPSRVATTMPIRPPTGSGTASVIHSVMTRSSTAASRCSSRSSPVGRTRNRISSAGARKSPTVRRPRSKRSSAAETTSWPCTRSDVDGDAFMVATSTTHRHGLG